MVFTSVSCEKVDCDPARAWKLIVPETYSFVQMLQSLEPDQFHESHRDTT